MRSKSQADIPKKINFIEKNRKYVSTLANKQQNSKVAQLRSMSTNIPEIQPAKYCIPKSQIPGFSFKLSFPEVDESETLLSSALVEEYKMYPKNSFSDTDCPPTPPCYPLEEIEEIAGDQSPEVKIYQEATTQTEKKLLTKKIEYSLRRSERLAKIKQLKRKSSESCLNAKKLKFN